MSRLSKITLGFSFLFTTVTITGVYYLKELESKARRSNIEGRKGDSISLPPPTFGGPNRRAENIADYERQERLRKE
ncbi:hypothetical protein BJ742DRAFT_816680, partial [Cladochytrium replicatum]